MSMIMINKFIIDTDWIPGYFLLLKNYIAQRRYYFYLSSVRILLLLRLLTWLANYNRTSR